MALLVLIILVVMAYSTVPAASQCTNDCCYYYRFSPSNLTCNPQGHPKAVILGCSIYSPNGSDVTVRWYRSTQEHLARVQGELVTNGRNQDYIRNTQLPFKGLILSHHLRTIENFNENLNGLYWCLIEVNNTCLQPSPYGRIIFDSSSQRNCSSDNIVIHRPVQPLCANNSRTCPVGKTTTLSTSISETPTALCLDDVVPCNLSIVTSTLSATPTALCSDGAVCNLGIVIGAAVVVCILLVVLLVVMILLLRLIMRRRKEKKMNCVSHSATQSTERSNELAGRNETELAPMNSTPGLTSISFGVPNSDPSATEPFLDDDRTYDTFQEKKSQVQASTENEMIFDDPTYAVNPPEAVSLTQNRSREELAYHEAALTSNIRIKVSTSDIGTGEVFDLEPDTPALVQVQRRAPDSRVTLESTDSIRL